MTIKTNKEINKLLRGKKGTNSNKTRQKQTQIKTKSVKFVQRLSSIRREMWAINVKWNCRSHNIRAFPLPRPHPIWVGGGVFRSDTWPLGQDWNLSDWLRHSQSHSHPDSRSVSLCIALLKFTKWIVSLLRFVTICFLTLFYCILFCCYLLVTIGQNISWKIKNAVEMGTSWGSAETWLFKFWNP